MINKKAWEKSFRKVNGREPNEKEYQKAVLDGLVKGPDEINSRPKKTYVIIGIIVGAFLLIIITFVSTLLLFPAPKSNHTESFNTGSVESVASTSSSSQSSSSDTSQQDLTTWQNLSLNEQIALLAQSYTAINPQTSLLSADKIAMTANGDKGVNDGFIQWYDATNNLHRLDVLINDETISFSYIGDTGQSERKKGKISSILSTYFQTNTAKQTTETLALKIVTPVELYQSKDINKTSSNSKNLVNEVEILNKNYTSLNGIWKNSHGEQIIIDHGIVTDNNKKYSLISPQKNNHLIFLNFSPAPMPNGMSIMIATQGTTARNNSNSDGTDYSRDRIIKANNGGSDLFAVSEKGGIPDIVYYRID